MMAFALALAASWPASAWAGPMDDALTQAVQDGDHDAVRTLLARHVNPNRVQPDKSSLMAWAVDRQDEQTVQLLLAAGANPNVVDLDGATPLILACEAATPPAIIDMLLDAHADTRAARWDGVSVMALCAGHSTPAVLERLITSGTPADLPDAKGQTPLMWAAANGKLENFALLLKHGANVNRASKKGFTPLFFAIKSPEPKMALAVLDAGGDGAYTAPDGTTALQLAIYQHDFPLAVSLVERGADVKSADENGNQPLAAAAIAGNEALVKALLAKGADPNSLTVPSKVNWQKEPNSNTPVPPFVAFPPLLLAAQNGNAAAMKALADGGARKDGKAADGTNVLLAAATGGALDAFAYAFEIAPDPTVHTNAASVDHNTLARATGNDVIHSILSNNRVMITGKTTADAPAMIRLAVDKGAPLDGKNTRGQTVSDLVFRSSDDIKAAYAEIMKTRGGVPPPRLAEAQ